MTTGTKTRPFDLSRGGLLDRFTPGANLARLLILGGLMWLPLV